MTKDNRKRKTPKKITEKYLRNSGLYYLKRFVSSSENFRKVMKRKIYKSCQHHEDQKIDDCHIILEKVVKDFEEAGYLNDELYSRAMVRSLVKSGKSKTMINQKLRQKGLTTDQIQQALSFIMAEYDENLDLEMASAAKLCKKKRIGPFQRTETDLDDEDAKKDHMRSLGILSRAGYSYDTAQKALNLTHDEAIEMISELV